MNYIMKKNMKSIIIGLTIMGEAIGIGAYMVTLNSSKNPPSNIQAKSRPVNEIESESDVKPNYPRKPGDARHEVAASIHLMANGLIIAEGNEVDGHKSMSQDELNATYKLIQTLPDGAEKTKFTEIITRWRNCDFSQIVEEHNMVWRILGEGQPESELKGKAIGVDESALKPTINLIKRGDYSKDK